MKILPGITAVAVAGIVSAICGGYGFGYFKSSEWQSAEFYGVRCFEAQWQCTFYYPATRIESILVGFPVFPATVANGGLIGE